MRTAMTMPTKHHTARWRESQRERKEGEEAREFARERERKKEAVLWSVLDRDVSGRRRRGSLNSFEGREVTLPQKKRHSCRRRNENAERDEGTKRTGALPTSTTDRAVTYATSCSRGYRPHPSICLSISLYLPTSLSVSLSRVSTSTRLVLALSSALSAGRSGLSRSPPLHLRCCSVVSKKLSF